MSDEIIIKVVVWLTCMVIFIFVGCAFFELIDRKGGFIDDEDLFGE